VPCGSVFALTEPIIVRLHSHDSANHTLICGGLYRAHSPSCAVIFPSMACRHALPQTLSVFVCFRSSRSISTYTGHQRSVERSSTPCAARLIWVCRVTAVANCSWTGAIPPLCPRHSKPSSQHPGWHFLFEKCKVAAAEQLLNLTIGTRNLEIILGDDCSSPLPRGKSAVIQECLCLSCACMATRGSRKALPSREASGGGLEVRRLGVNLTRRGRDRI